MKRFFTLLFMLPVLSASAQLPPLVSTAWLAQHQNDSNLVILHVDPRLEHWQKGHIGKARFFSSAPQALTVSDATHNYDLPAKPQLDSLLGGAGLRPEHNIVVYGTSWTVVARAFFTLEFAGWKGRVAVLNGGLGAWLADGFPLTQVRYAYPVTQPSVSPDSSILATALQVKQALASGTQFLDVRTYNEYRGTNDPEDNPRWGHLPGARFLPYQFLISDASSGPLLPPDQLKKKLRSAGINTRQPLVVYCQSGGRAALGYLAARIAGTPVRMYDGSFYEWSRLSATVAPVETGPPAGK